MNKLTWLKNKLVKIIINIFLIYFCSQLLFYTLLKPEPYLDIEHFQVCVIENEKEQLIFLKRRKQQPLCQLNGRNSDQYTTSSDYNFSFLPTKNKDEGQIVAYGSTADPLIFTYTLANNGLSVVPLWQMKGEYWAQYFSYIFSIILVFIFNFIAKSKIIKFIFKRFNKKLGK